MATYSKELLSGSTNGKAILVTATGTTGTAIHTAVSGTSSLDEIWLYAFNTSTSNVKLTVEFGGTSSPNDTIEVTINAEAGLTLVVPGLLLNNACAVTAFAGTGSVVSIVGYVNRIAP